MLKIISCFWNASNFIEDCIHSVKNQSFKDFKMYLVDDVSTDNTIEKIKNLIYGDNRFELIINKNKKFKLQNIDDLIRNSEIIHDEDIIIELDGDDKLASNDVLGFISEKYVQNSNLWLTNGSFIYKSGNPGFSSRVNPEIVRQTPFTFSHLRTWKAHLWRKINKKDFYDDFGNLLVSAPDLAYSFPMVEMAGNRHYEFIPEVLYVYNDESPFNEFKSDSAGGGKLSQIMCETSIRRKPRYLEI